MKKFLILPIFIFGLIVFSACAHENDVLDNETEIQIQEDDMSDKTIGEQIKDAEKSVKSCKEDCIKAGGLLSDCEKSCETLEKMFNDMSDATKDFHDMTEEEMVEDMQKKALESIPAEAKEKMKELEGAENQMEIPVTLPVSTSGGEGE